MSLVKRNLLPAPGIIFLLVAGVILTAPCALAVTNTSLSLTSSCVKSGVGQYVTFQATVKANGATAMGATGRVFFYTNGTSFGSALVFNGQAYSPMLRDLPPGTKSITATYDGDSQYSASSGGPLTQTVLPPAGATITNSMMSITIGANAAITSVKSLVSGGQEINAGSEGFSIYRKLSNTTIPMDHFAPLGNNQFLMWSDNGYHYVIWTIAAANRYFKVALVRASNNPQTGGIDNTWPGSSPVFRLKLSLPSGYSMRTLKLDGMTDYGAGAPNFVSWFYTGTMIECFWNNVEYSQVTSLVAGTGRSLFPISQPEPMGAMGFFISNSDAQHDDIMLDMWSGEPAMPRPNRANQPSWTRSDVSAWLDRWERELGSAKTVVFAPTAPGLGQYKAMVDQMSAHGMNTLYLFNSYWGGNKAVDEISTYWFPNGLSDIKELAQYASLKGVRLSLHAMSGSVELDDPTYGALSPAGLSPEISRWATGTLLDPVTSATTSFRVQPDAGCKMIASPPWGSRDRVYPPYYIHPQGLISINNDVMYGSSAQSTSTVWTVSNVNRNNITQYGQRWGMNHPAGTRVDFLLSEYNQFPMIDSRSQAIKALAQRYGNLLNTLNCPEQNYDGQDVNWDLGVWGWGKFARIVQETVDHPTLSTSAMGIAAFGHFENVFKRISRLTAGEDYYAYVRLNHPGFMASGIDEINVSFAHAIATGQRLTICGEHIGVTLDAMNAYGLTSKVISSLKLWSALGPSLTSGQRTLLSAWGYDFYEPTENSTQWVVTPKRAMARDGIDVCWSNMQEWGPISPRQFCKVGDIISGLNNPYAAQTPQIEVFVLPAMTASNGANISLMPAAPSDLIHPPDVVQPISMDASGVLSVSAVNSTGNTVIFTPKGNQSYWNYKVGGVAANLDMSQCRGVALTVTGDGSGADLVFRIIASGFNQDTGGFGRDYVIPLNFTGTKTIAIPNSEVMWYKTSYGFGDDYSTCGTNMDYTKITGFSFYLGKMPVGKSATAKISGIKAMQEDRSTGLVSPSLTLNGVAAFVAGTIPYNNYLVYSGGNKAQVYDANWHYKMDLTVGGPTLTAVTGSNNTFSVTTNGSPNAWLSTRVKVKGTPWVIQKQ